MNTLVFRMPSGGSVSDYLAFYYTGNFLVHVPANLEQYVETLRFTYTPAIGGFRFIALITGAAFLTLSILGFIRKILTHMEVYDWFFIIYLFILLVFPNNFSAYRLLIPLGFILLYYAALGFKSIRLPSVFMGKNLVILFGTVILVLFIPGIIQVFQARNTVLEGPQEQRAAHAFRYISGNIPDSSLVVFFKPRALALYTGKQGMVDPFSNDLTAIYTQVHNAGADYILIHNELTSESMKRFVRIMKSRVELVWKNRRYQLYKIVPPDPADLF
jgi:preprotein translocase subunit Sss1